MITVMLIIHSCYVEVHMSNISNRVLQNTKANIDLFTSEKDANTIVTVIKLQCWCRNVSETPRNSSVGPKHGIYTEYIQLIINAYSWRYLKVYKYIQINIHVPDLDAVYRLLYAASLVFTVPERSHVMH